MDGIEEVTDMEIALLEAFTTITPEECQGCIAQSGLLIFLIKNTILIVIQA